MTDDVLSKICDGCHFYKTCLEIHELGFVGVEVFVGCNAIIKMMDFEGELGESIEHITSVIKAINRLLKAIK